MMPSVVLKSSVAGPDPRPEQQLNNIINLLNTPSEIKAKYKIEVMFSRHRSSLAHKNSPAMVTIWESGKRYHGGGDEKMYWCGYDDCDMPISADNFAAFHCVCPHCKKELFLDRDSKNQHIAYLKRDGVESKGIQNLKCVAGERLVNLTPVKLATLLEKTWIKLSQDADFYIKYSPFEIRYDAKRDSDTKVIDALDKARIQRQPVIYPLKNVVKDLCAGAQLRGRLVAFLTS